MKSSIRTTMYYAVSFLIVIPVLLLSLILSYIYAIKLESVITDSLQAVATTQIAEMDALCERQKNNLEIIGEMEVSRAALRGELDIDTLSYLNNMLASRVQMTDYLNSITIIDTNRRVVACSLENYDTLAKKGFSTLHANMGSEPFWITDVMTISGNGNGDEHKAVFAIFRVEENGKTLGHVLSEIDLSFYDEIRQQAKLWNESTFYLLDGSGEIIIAGTQDENRADFITTPEERRDYEEQYRAIDFAAHPQGSFQYKVAGRDYITYYSDTRYTNWRMMLSVNMDNYTEQRSNYAVTACILVLFCAALALWIGAFTSKRIVHPIKSITDTLGRVQQRQDYSLRVKAEREDELCALSAEINKLLTLIEAENLYHVQMQRQLQEKADRDALTKVLNREKLMQHLQEAIPQCHDAQSELAVLFVDVDNFKEFNTLYGHGVGDQVLLFVATLLAKETGGTVGRVGGDEFMVIVNAPEHLQTLERSLARVNEKAESQFVIRNVGRQVPVSVCIGAVRADFSKPHSAEFTPAQLASWADAAMYRIKNNGKHGYVICDAEQCFREETT